MFVLLIVIKLIMSCVCVLDVLLKRRCEMFCVEAAIFFMHTIKSKMNHSFVFERDGFDDNI